MRLALLCRGDLFPTYHGAAVKIVKSAEGFAAHGDAVVVITEDRQHYQVVGADGWAPRAYGAEFLSWARRFYHPSWVDAVLRRLGYPKEEWLLYRPLVDADWWLRALYVGAREHIDVFQAEFPAYAAPATFAARVLGARVLLSEHNAEFDRLARTTELPARVLGRLRRVEVLLARHVDRVMAVSEEDRTRLTQAGLERDHVSVMPLGVDTAEYRRAHRDLRATYGLPDLPIVFFHGTLHYAPNAAAIRFLAREVAPALAGRVTIVVAGMSPPRELASENLVFVGPVDDLPAHVLGADLCVCPIEGGGGTRMKLLEYFAAGKPVVSTGFGAEGLGAVPGRHFELASLREFVPTILKLLADSERRDLLGAEAQRFASARDWRRVVEATRRIHDGERIDFVPAPVLDAHLPPRKPSKPLTMLFLINRGCNLRCSFCDLWEGHQQVPVDAALSLLDEAKAIGTRTVVFTGGEPLLHPGLPTLIAAARERGLAVNLTTNGTLLLRHLHELEQAGLDSLSISLDGLAPTHDILRGQPGAFVRSWEALVRVVRDARVGASVYYTVNRQNVGELVPTWERVRALGAGFDFWPVNDAPDLYLRPEDHETWLSAVATIARHDPAVAARKAYYAEALAYHGGRRGPVRCLGLVDQFGVTVDGDLLPCCVWGGEGLRVGNVFQTPLRELWWSPAVMARREHLVGKGCDAGCYNHSLYEFTESTGMSFRLPSTP